MQASAQHNWRRLRSVLSLQADPHLSCSIDRAKVTEPSEVSSKDSSLFSNLSTFFSFPTITEMLNRVSRKRWDSFYPLFRSNQNGRWFKLHDDSQPQRPNPNLLELPQELLLTIVEMIEGPDNLYNLMRTHRIFYPMVIARLYRTLVFRDVHNDGSGELLSCLQVSPTDDTWAYWVQEVNVGPTIGCARRSSQTSEVWTLLCRVLSAVPENQLKKVSIDVPHTGTAAEHLHLIANLTARHRSSLRHIMLGLYRAKVRELTLVAIEVMTAHGADLFYNVENFQFLFCSPRAMAAMHIIFLGAFRLSALTFRSTSIWPTIPRIPPGYPLNWIPAAPSIMLWLPMRQTRLRKLNLTNLSLPVFFTARALSSMNQLTDLTFDNCELLLDAEGEQPNWQNSEATQQWVDQFDKMFTNRSIENVVIRGDCYGVVRMLVLFGFRRLRRLACIMDKTERARVPLYMSHLRGRLVYFVLGLELSDPKERDVVRLPRVEDVLKCCPLHAKNYKVGEKWLCIYGYPREELERTPGFELEGLNICHHWAPLCMKEEENLL